MIKNISIRFGLIASLVFITWVSVEHLLGLNTTKIGVGEITRLLSAFVFYLFIALCLRAEKKALGGQLLFARGIKTGALMILIYGIITAVWLAIYQHLINPGILEDMMRYTEEKLKATNATPAEINDAVEEVEMIYSGTFTSYLFYFIFSSVAGFVVALITALLLRTKQKEN